MSCSDSQHCITCGDDGVEMTVVAVDPGRGLALCADADGVRQSVETALVDPVAPGARLLVHAGTAIVALAGPGPGDASVAPGPSALAPASPGVSQ